MPVNVSPVKPIESVTTFEMKGGAIQIGLLGNGEPRQFSWHVKAREAVDTPVGETTSNGFVSRELE
jgi:hypothetical protein